jgi:hypothetical protein
VELAKQQKPKQTDRTTDDSQQKAPSGIPTVRSNSKPKKLSASELKRRSVIFGALQSNLEGRTYCMALDQRGVTTPSAWVAEGCPTSYAAAYADSGTWQKRIQDEKSRYKKKYEQTSPIEREKMIQQAPATRRTRH